jgi:putative PEP-CTERM system histidine kinase
MTFYAILHYSAACFCAGVAIFALLRDQRSFVHLIFALGLAALAIESVFMGLTAQALLPEQAISWQQSRLMVSALLPGIWLLFSLSFGREDKRRLPAKWKWAVLAIFLLHLVFVSLLRADFFRDTPVYIPNGWEFGLGWSGYAFHVCYLLSLVLIVMVLEQILRASKGRKRWQIKFFVFAIGGIFAIRIYTVSHTLVFQMMNPEIEVVNAAALLAASFLIVVAIFRAGNLQMEIYLSQKILYNSLTVMVVGIYFLAMGISTVSLQNVLSFPFRVLLIFLALLGMFMLLFSDRLRLKMKRFVSRHFRRPQYDYREVWMTFTQRTATLLEEKALCDAVSKLISEMFDTLSVSLWLLDNKGKDIRWGASTAISSGRAEELSDLQKGIPELVDIFRRQPALLDLEDQTAANADNLRQSLPDHFQEPRTRYILPLSTGNNLLGFITMGDRVRGYSFSIEEMDLLQTIAAQVASNLLNIRLSERLRRSGEMEAFQKLAAFFVHDLKNLASKLSLMLKNLPVHFENPEFRNDALRLLSQSADQVESICSRLSSLREKLELRPEEIDLNEMVAATLAGHNGFPTECLVKNLQPVPKVFADREHIQKVLANLILNATDAISDGGSICVTTWSRDGWVELAVSDTGCGISKEFMNECLFRPFKTTKLKGTGIGLFQSKMIVEAHEGLIEVESQEGKGSTFRVLLPVK